MSGVQGAAPPQMLQYGHPTEALLVAVEVYIKEGAAVTKEVMRAVLTRPVSECADLEVGPSKGGWTAPCVDPGTGETVCRDRLCLGIRKRLWALDHFAEIVDATMPPAPTPASVQGPDLPRNDKGNFVPKPRPAGPPKPRPPRSAAAAKKAAKPPLPPPPLGVPASKVLNDVYTHIDAHMPLLCALNATAGFVGADGQCDAKHVAEMVRRAPVSIAEAYTEADVPNVAALMPLTISYNNSTLSNRKIAEMRMPDFDRYNIDIVLDIVGILFKGIHNRCYNRELFDVLINATARTEYIAQFFVKIMVASLLGVYRSSRVKMPIDQRTMLYQSFYTPLSIEELHICMTAENKNPLLYIVKEFYQATAERMPGFLDAMKTVYDWTVYEKYNLLFMDEMRRRVSATAKACGGEADLARLFYGVDRECNHIHNKSRKTQREKNLRGNPGKIFGLLNAYNYDTYDADEHPLPEKLSDDDTPWHRRGRLTLKDNPNPNVPENVEACLRAYIHLFPRDSHIPVAPLVFFGLPPAKTEALAHAMFAKKPDLIRLVDDLPRAQYAVVYTYFKLLADHKGYREFLGDAHMRLCHARALNQFYNVYDGDKIPAVAGKIEFCPNCEDTKMSSFYVPESRRNAKGQGTVVFSLDGRRWCAREPAHRDCHEAHRSKPLDQQLPRAIAKKKTARHTKASLMRKVAKSIAVDHKYDRCNFTETRVLNCLNRVTRLGKFMYFACYDCLDVTRNDARFIVGSKMLCRKCAHITAHHIQRARKCDHPRCSRPVNPANCLVMTCYDDVTPHAELEGRSRFREIRICAAHGDLHWLRHARTYRLLSDIHASTKRDIWSARSVRC